MSKPILVIDDEEKFALMLQDLLARNGFAADVCLNPEEGLQMLGRGSYQLVVSDYKMPEMDGAEFLQKARKLQPELPVIMISGLMNMPELIKVANIGVTLVLEKPFDTEDFLGQVARFIAPGIPVQGQGQDTPASGGSLRPGAEEAGVAALTYPHPARELADNSPENQRFLEALWQQFQVSRHLFFYASRGSEVRLVAREVLGWMQQDPENPWVLMDLMDTLTELTRDLPGKERPFPELLVVDVRGMGWTEESRRVLREWIAYLEGLGEAAAHARVLYALPPGCGFCIDELSLEPGVARAVGGEVPVLQALRDRLEDAAGYIRRMLGDPICAGLEPQLRGQLLSYPWPGGYVELQTKMTTLREAIESRAGDPLTLAAALLDGQVGAAAESPEQSPVFSFLLRRQQDFIALHRLQDESTRDTLLRIGVELSGLSIPAVESGRHFIYPAVLEEDDA